MLLKKGLSLIMLFFIVALFNPLSAQNSAEKWKLVATVLDEEGYPLSGASVEIKGSKVGTVANTEGVFSLDVAANNILVVKYLGYTTQEIKISNQKTLQITLKEAANALDEVTITALGIKREKKVLGYAVGEVKGEELTKAKEMNVVNALAGKIPGLIISQTAGGPAGSSRVLIRGNTEISGNNEPLYVVDGVPLDNSSFGSADTYGGYDLGDGISSINPDDIENISVLKGPAASALYGSRASHGVILITTKKAGGKKKLGVEFNSTTTIDQQLTQYDIQTVYGQGSNGRMNPDTDIYSTNSSWGPKYDDGLYIEYFDKVRRPYKYVPNNINGFFRTGWTSTNTVVLNSVEKNTGIRLSYTNMQNQDIVPNTGMDRNTVNLRATSKFLDKIEVDMKMNYVRENVKNRPALSGSNYNLGSNLMRLPSSFDQAWLKNHTNEKGEYYNWNGNDPWNLNPYWVVYAMENNSIKDRFSGSSALNYAINKQFNFRLTGGGEINIFDFMNYAPFSTPGVDAAGTIERRNMKNYTYNVEALLSFKERYGLFDVGANVGGNVFNVNNRNTNLRARENIMRHSTALQSYLYKESSESAYRKQINSVFGMINLGYNDLLFLDATIRTDKSSTLPAENNVYTYPSVSGSFLFSELFSSTLKKVLSFGKLRISAAQVGSDTGPFQLGLTYNSPDKPYGNIPYATVDNRLYDTDDRARVPNKNLKPTRTNSIETGIDLKFFQNRLGLDVTYYTQNSRDQILYLPIANSSSFNEKLVNAGNIENTGLEIMLTTTPIRTKDFEWNLDFNVAKNRNRVLKLTDELSRFSLAKAEWLGVTIDAMEGLNYGAIVSSNALIRNENGDLLINPENGLPYSTNDKLQVLGNAMWDWTGGISTSLQYRDFTLSTIIDVKVGADLYSMTARSLYNCGKSKMTLEGRDAWYRSEEERMEACVNNLKDWTPTGGYLVQGVCESTDGGGNTIYVPNTRYADPQKYWEWIATYDPSFFVFDNSYVKMREITFTYRCPRKLIGKFADELSVSIVARNPFIIWKNIPNIDPDSNYNNGAGMGLEYGSLPSRKSYGININLKF